MKAMNLVAGTIFLFLFFSVSPCASASSSDFWNPFRDSEIVFSDEIKKMMAGLLVKITDFTNQTVSNYKIPGWQSTINKTTGNSGRGEYKSATLNFRDWGYKYLSNNKPVVPAPIAGEKSDDNPCGGRQTDSYWAEDCSCRCSRGGLPNLDYEVSDRCPENDNLACEDCRKITRHNNIQTTIAQCRDSF